MSSVSTNRTTKVKIIEYTINLRVYRIYLGKIPISVADSINVKVNELVSAKLSGTPIPQETAIWLNKIDKRLYKKLLHKDLVPKKDEDIVVPTLNDYLTNYLNERTDLADTSKKNYKTTRDKLITFFGTRREINSITRDDAKAFLKTMSYMSTNSRSLHLTTTKHFFKQALEDELILRNPFATFKSKTIVDATKHFEITRELFYEICNHTDDAELRFLFCCYRLFMRRAGDPLHLMWKNVSWQNQEITFTTPKNMKRGRGTTIVPIFPECIPFIKDLEKTCKDTSPNAKMIQKYKTKPQIRKALIELLLKAGVKPWAKLLIQCRSNRISELLQAGFEVKAVADWSNNTPQIIYKFYALKLAKQDDKGKTTITGYVPPEPPKLQLVG